MHATVYPVSRSFDNRVVYRWELVDTMGRLRDSGVSLSYDAALRAADRARQCQGPDSLLDILECRQAPPK